MAKLNELQKYLNYEFSTDCYTDNDYKSFQTKYINYLKNVCTENNWELVRTMKNHYTFSVFIKSKEKYVYLSISDVRFNPNNWWYCVLIRTAQNDNDFTGGQNNFTDLPKLTNKIKYLFGE